MIRVIRSGYLGTETPYIYQKSRYTLPPVGYEPFFINHLGRHGARYLSSDQGINKLLDTLKRAESLGMLKEEGKRLQDKLERIAPIEEASVGLLTASGIQMEEGIASRMIHYFPQVFGKKVIAVSTYVTRTKESMEAFLGELSKWTSSSCFEASSNGRIDPVLRFFDLNKAYLKYKEEGKWRELVKTYEKRQNDMFDILKLFFMTPYLAKLEDPYAWVADLYAVYANQFDARENVGLGIYFTDEQLRYLWENENLRQYLEKGPSYVGQCLPTHIAFPLLMDFLRTSETAIREREWSAYLRFAHAETIIPFSSMMRLLGFFNQTNCMSHVATLWQDYWVAPMAANMQWIFYAHPEEERVLVKMLYNETEVRLPIRSVCGPYYDWRAVRMFYIKQLQALKLDWQKDLVEMVEDYTETSCFCNEEYEVMKKS